MLLRSTVISLGLFLFSVSANGGILTLGPGLGVEIDESIVEKYPFIPGPWSYFKIDSPPETVAVTGDHSVKWVEGDQTS